jgi:hypothetical protein
MVFVKAASKVKCLVCGEMLAEPTGGKARFNVKILGQQEKEKPAKEKEGGTGEGRRHGTPSGKDSAFRQDDEKEEEA